VVWQVIVAIARFGAKREHKSSLMRRKGGQEILVSLCKMWGAGSFRGKLCIDGKLRSKLLKISTDQLKQSCRRSVSACCHLTARGSISEQGCLCSLTRGAERVFPGDSDQREPLQFYATEARLGGWSQRLIDGNTTTVLNFVWAKSGRSSRNTMRLYTGTSHH
jgi:hypothetical protein